MDEKTKTEDERIMAAIAHAGIIVGGLLISLIVWLTQKEKSKYVGFQAKQALVYQLAVVVICSILGIAGFVIGFMTFGLEMLVVVPVIMLLWFVTLIYGLYAAYKTYLGEDFRYWIIADMLEKKT